MNQTPAPYPSSTRAWVTVAILMIAYVISFIDRQILNLLVGPIRRDLQISDTQMSYLLGLSFALFYTICGIPLGRLADSKSRKGIIAFGIVLWSLMTAGCGMARHYFTFLFFRMGVGVGEATLSPSAYSLIADSFEKEKRATAISVYSMGIYLGSGLALLLGGLIIRFASAQGDLVLPVLGEVRPWQLIFFILGPAGLVFSLAVLAIREPVRKGIGAGIEVPIKQVAAYLRSNRATVLHHNVGFALMSFTAYGALAWVPSFFIRTYGWTAAHTGIVYGTITLIFGASGVVFGGRLADFLARRGYADATMRVGLVGAIVAVPFSIVYPLANTPEMAAALMSPAIFCLAMPFGVAPAAIQEIMPNSMRGQASALYLFTINLIGLGLGPTAVALVTDYVFHDDKSLRYSLLIVSIGAEAGAILLLSTGLKHYRGSLERLKGWVVPITAA